MPLSRETLLNEDKGFTLLEVLVALAILGIAITVIIQLFSANLRALSASEDYVSASLQGAAKMRALLDEQDLSERAWTETSPEGYRFDIAVKESLTDRTEILPVRLLDIALTIQWTKGNRVRSMTFQTLKLIKKEI
jgi:prepilin-type N-terminal cleavage/methylation domain-containing protein